MASFALGIVGGLLGPVGAAAGSIVGAYIDRAVINPLLNPKENIEGPRAADFRLQQQEEGAVANWCLGGTNRLSGVIIYAESVREVDVEEEVGGKGGGGQKVTRHNYYTTLAISFGIQRGLTVSRIRAEGDLVYDANPNLAVTGNTIAAAPVGTNDVRMKLTAPDGGPDLSQFQSGKDATVAGFVNAANNGTWLVEQAGAETGGTFVIVRNGAAALEAAGPTVAVTQTRDPWDPAKVEHVELYTGSQVGADETIEAARGIGAVPAYTGTAYVVLKNFLLNPYGGRVPLFTFEVASATGTTVRTAVEAICKRAGLADAEVDATGLTGTNRGYALSGPVSPLSALQPLMLRHDVLTQEAGGVLRFFHRADATVVFIPRDELAADAGLNGERPTPWSVARPSALLTLPPRMLVSYVKAENGERGSEPFVRNGEEQARTEHVYLPLAMTAAEARAVEKRLAYAARLAADTHRLKLSPRWCGLGENDVIATWWTPGELIFLQVLRVDETDAHDVLVEAKLWHRALSTQDEDGDTSDAEPVPSTAVGGVDPFVLLAPNFDAPGIPGDVIRPVVGCANPDENDDFVGVALYGSVEGVEYKPLAVFAQQATSGFARTVLPGAGVDTEVWDRASTVDVEVWHGTLESRSEADVLNGANVALIGGEAVSFASAELIGPRLYRLSVLLRGRRDTVDALEGHEADERFVLMTAPGTKLIDVALTALGTTRYFKFVPNGSALDDVAATSLVIDGRNLRPFAPTALFASRDDAGNLSLSWNRRTRVPVPDFPTGPVPVGEEVEKYEVEFWWSSSLRRTVTVTAPAASYSEAEQTEDGVDLFSAVEVRVYQLGAAYGRGRALIGSV